MRNISTFFKVRATMVAATIAIANIGASVPVQVSASSVSSDIMQFVESDFGAYLDRVNDGVSFSNAKTAKDAFAFVNQGVEIYGEDWRFNAWAGDCHFDFTSGELTSGGYATGATINVRVGEESLFTASRDGDQVKIDNGFFDLDEYTATTTPFILTGQASWGGIVTISSADLALACAIYDFMVEENAKQQATTDPEVPETIDPPASYGVIDFAGGDKIDTELIALAAAVDQYCSAAPRE